jgi:hypothetical protein
MIIIKSTYFVIKFKNKNKNFSKITSFMSKYMPPPSSISIKKIEKWKKLPNCYGIEKLLRKFRQKNISKVVCIMFQI